MEKQASDLPARMKSRKISLSAVPIFMGMILLSTPIGVKANVTAPNAQKKEVIQTVQKQEPRVERIIYASPKQTKQAKQTESKIMVEVQNKEEKELKDKVWTFCGKILKTLEKAAIWSLCAGGVASLAVGIGAVVVGEPVVITAGIGIGAIAGVIAGSFIGVIDGFMNAGLLGAVVGAVGGSFVGKFLGFVGSLAGGVVSAVAELGKAIIERLNRD